MIWVVFWSVRVVVVSSGGVRLVLGCKRVTSNSIPVLQPATPFGRDALLWNIYPYSNPRRDMTYIHKNPQDESPLSLPSCSHTLWEGRIHTLSQEGTCQHVEINQLQFVKFWFFFFPCPSLLSCPFPSVVLSLPSQIVTCCPSLLLWPVVPPF